MIWDCVNLYHMYLFRLILQAKSFVLFYLWYSSCFEVKCWIHTFHKCCSHIATWILILLDHWGRHVNSFQTGALLFEMIPSFPPSARSILSFLKGVCFVHPKLSLFSHPPTLFLQGLLYILIKYPFIHVKSLHPFQSMFWSIDPSWRCSRASSLLFFISFSSPVDPIQAFGVDHILFPCSNAIPCRCIS